MSNNTASRPSSPADNKDAHYQERLANCVKALQSRDEHIAEVAEFTAAVKAKKGKIPKTKVLDAQKGRVKKCRVRKSRAKKPKWEEMSKEERDKVVEKRYEKAGFKLPVSGKGAGSEAE